MPNNRKITKKAIKGKEGIHPGSRKAGQITRAALRTVKLQQQNKHRKGDVHVKLQRPIFFMHALSSGSPLTLASLKGLVEVYVARNDERIKELVAERRPGRPKQPELLDLEDKRRMDDKEFESGMEVPDLTYYLTSRLLYRYIETDQPLDLSRLAMIRMVRVFRNNDDMIVTKPGGAAKMGLGEDDGSVGEDWSGAAVGAAASGAGGEAGDADVEL